MNTAKEVFCLNALSDVDMERLGIVKDPKLNHYSISHGPCEHDLMDWPSDEHNYLIVNITGELGAMIAEEKLKSGDYIKRCFTFRLLQALAEKYIQARGNRVECIIGGDEIGELRISFAIKVTTEGIVALEELLETSRTFLAGMDSPRFQSLQERAISDIPRYLKDCKEIASSIRPPQ